MEIQKEEILRQSIYKASRSIKKRDNTLYYALLSIYHDSIFIGEISQLWPHLPLVANLRCGLWYSPRFDGGTCYFKSTDGHSNNCSFNTSRLNFHLALLAGKKGGCIIVDSTRKGKRFPDSMSKTIPVWSCVLNRAIQRYRNMVHENFSDVNEEKAKEASPDWDCSLHLPAWVPKTEKASIENRLDDFIALLEESGADITSLAASLRKPLRPLWISQKSVIWLNEVPDHDSWDFTPLILVSGSSSNGFLPQRTSSEFSWNYIPGAGDDEESWARGLTPDLFWNHVYDLINCGPDLCNKKVSEIVEKDRVYRVQRGQDIPQILVKSQMSSESNGHHELPLHSEFKNIQVGISPSTKRDSSICWLGLTNIAGTKLEKIIGRIELRKVDFAYPTQSENAILRQFSLEVKAGTSVGLVGKSGCGKSTVIALIQRFYDVDRGTIKVDGVDIREFDVVWYRKHMALVSQDPIIYSGSIRDNIVLGKVDTTENEVVEASKAANAHEFICFLKKGYQTECVERVVQLSGGQKQRIAIARAILRNPIILLLDEATSALDMQSESLVQEALDRVMIGRTTVVVAHRLNTIKSLDSITFIEDGKVVERGTYTQLKHKRGAFFNLASLQSLN